MSQSQQIPPIVSLKVNFLEPKSEKRLWGEEVFLAYVPGKFTLKLLKMKAGTKGNLQRHRVKDEVGHVLSGQMIVRYDKGDGTITEKVLNPGDTLHIPPGAVHQEEAVTDCVIVEASSPIFNDRVRVEKEYGLPEGEGMPTTDFPIIG